MRAAGKTDTTHQKRAAAATVEPVCVGGREGWRITYDGKRRTVTTSASSVAAIKEATMLYSGALRRLANR